MNTTSEVVLTRTIRAPRSLVFDAWVTPEHIERWFAPWEGTVTDVSVDARPGGLFRFCHRLPSIGEPVWVTAQYVIVEPPSRLVYRESFADEQGNAVYRPGFAFESTVDVTFVEREGLTEVIVRHTGLTMDQGEGEGWRQLLDRLAVLLEESQS